MAPPCTARVAAMRQRRVRAAAGGPRKTVYSMMRLSLSALPAERFWMLTGSGRNVWGSYWGQLARRGALGGTHADGDAHAAARRHGSDPGDAQSPPTPRAQLVGASRDRRRRGGAASHGEPTRPCPALEHQGDHRRGDDAARDCHSNDSRCDLWGTAVLQGNKPPRIVGTIDDSAVERLVVVHFPFTFTSDGQAAQRPDKVQAHRRIAQERGLHEGALPAVQLLLDECPDGTLFVAPECKRAASVYLGKQEKLQSFLDEHCVRQETAPMRQWLGVKEMLARYNAEMGSALKEKDPRRSSTHRATSADYKEKGQAMLSDAPIRRNTANGLLNWRLRRKTKARRPPRSASGSSELRWGVGGGGWHNFEMRGERGELEGRGEGEKERQWEWRRSCDSLVGLAWRGWPGAGLALAWR